MRPIDADALYDTIRDNACHDDVCVTDVLDFIDCMPPLDYTPVRRGEWLGCENYNDIAQCSLCGLIRNIYRQEGWNYCPNCGALMDWKEDGKDDT